MLRYVVTCALMLLGATVSVRGLICRSGFNASIAGVPFYQWYEEACAKDSKCFGHEIIVTIQGLDVVAQYGGCLSAGYSSLISCESLFGRESELNPADFLNIIPGLDQKVQAFVQVFTKNLTTNLQKLFTAGTDNQEFTTGLFKFYQNLGFNVEKFGPLEAPLGKLFTAIFSYPNDPRQIQTAVNELFRAFAELDTANPEIASDVYAFLQTIGIPKKSIQGTPYVDLVEKLPGLILSTLPQSFEANRWYDEMFKLLSKVNPGNPVQTVKDMIKIVKATDWIPNEYETYTDKFLDRLPELVAQLVAGNSSYPGYWSTLLLKDYSEGTTATNQLSQAVMNFLAGIGITNLPGEVMMVIKYLPGHFYNYFPDKRSEIDKVYEKIADGFDSFDFANLGSTKPTTTMSNFIISFIDKVAPGTLNDAMKPLIVNFSYMFYKLMEPDYKDEVDTFFTTLTEGFKNYPNFNLGQIVRNLVVNLGGSVPPEVEPLLVNIQNVVNTLTPTPNINLMVQQMKNLINAYRKAYPKSLFPAVFDGFIDYYMKWIVFDYYSATPEQADNFTMHMQLEAQYVAIDLQFALVQVMNLSTKQIESLMTSAFPEYGLFIKSLMILEPADVKQLVKDVGTWMFKGLRMDPPTVTSQGFVDAVKPTILKMAKKLGDVVKDYRRVLSPNSCKSAFCVMDNCNTNMKILRKPAVTKALPKAGITSTSTTTSTPSSSQRIAHSSLLIGIMVGVWGSLSVLQI